MFIKLIHQPIEKNLDSVPHFNHIELKVLLFRHLVLTLHNKFPNILFFDIDILIDLVPTFIGKLLLWNKISLRDKLPDLLLSLINNCQDLAPTLIVKFLTLYLIENFTDLLIFLFYNFLDLTLTKSDKFPYLTFLLIY